MTTTIVQEEASTAERTLATHFKALMTILGGDYTPHDVLRRLEVLASDIAQDEREAILSEIDRRMAHLRDGATLGDLKMARVDTLDDIADWIAGRGTGGA